MFNYPYYVFENVFTKDECELILNTSVSNHDKDVKDIKALGKNLKCFHIDLKKYLPDFFNNIISKTEIANQQNFDYHLYDQYKYSKFTNINVYLPNNEYQYHIDSEKSGSKSDIKLTTIVNISTEDYTGGEFVYVFGNKETRIEEIDKPGNMIVFPSFFLHRVLPVNTGKRVTLSYWFAGPSWK